MHLLIFDPHQHGHYLTFIRYLLPAAACASRVTVVLRTNAEASAEYREQLAPYADAFTLAATIRGESWRNGEQLLHDFSSACETHRPDHVWVPNADLLIRVAACARLRRGWRVLPGLETECGVTEARFHRPPRRWRGYIRHFIHRGVYRAVPFARIHTIDPTFYTWVERHSRPLARKCSLVPDPIDDHQPITKTDARRQLGIAPDGRYVGSIGAHAIERKGTGLLLDAFKQAQLEPTDRLLIVGPLGDRVRQRLAADLAGLHDAGRIVALDRYVNEAELMQSIAAMDVVVAPYIDHWGSSGIVMRAAQMERPVLVPDEGWFHDIVPFFRLGLAGDILNRDGLARGVEVTLRTAAEYRTSARCARLLEYSRAANFARLWAARLRQRMGLSADPAARTWRWVTSAAASG